MACSIPKASTLTRPIYVLHDLLREHEKKGARGTGRSRARPLQRGIWHETAHPDRCQQYPLAVEVLLDAVWIPGNVGHPVQRSTYVVGDKGYCGTPIRQAIEERSSTPIIPKKSNQKAEYYFDKKLYRNRNVVEHRIGWLKESRSIGTRYGNLALNYLGFVVLGCIQHYLKLLEPLVK